MSGFLFLTLPQHPLNGFCCAVVCIVVGHVPAQRPDFLPGIAHRNWQAHGFEHFEVVFAVPDRSRMRQVCAVQAADHGKRGRFVGRRGNDFQVVACRTHHADALDL